MLEDLGNLLIEIEPICFKMRILWIAKGLTNYFERHKLKMKWKDPLNIDHEVDQKVRKRKELKALKVSCKEMCGTNRFEKFIKRRIRKRRSQSQFGMIELNLFALHYQHPNLNHKKNLSCLQRKSKEEKAIRECNK